MTAASPNDESQRLRTFDEWMKIAADNKINSANAWNLALIDYFADMNVLRDGDSINFQRASCTLDGCVKVYSTRVDSVDADTKNLISGFFGGIQKGDELEEIGKEKRKKQMKVENTIEKDIALLNVKKIESEFLIDPLFKKTSADFDEGTASGLLLNHLNMTNDGMIIFDASDDVTVSKQMSDTFEGECVSPTLDLVDISRLKANIANALLRLPSLFVCPSLKSFDFSTEANEISKFDFDSILNMKVPQIDDIEDRFASNDAFATSGEHFENDDNSSVGDDGVDREMLQSGGDENFESHRDERAQYGEITFDEEGEPIGSKGTILQNGYGSLIESSGATAKDSPFAYFDSSMVRRWAGPDYWKPKPIIKIRDSTTAAAKKKREPTKIDFFDRTVTEKQLFAAGSVSITQQKYSEKSRAKNLLPKDENFSAHDFLKLFLKPNSKIVFRKRGNRFKPDNSNPSDPEFWSQHQNDEVSFFGGAGRNLFIVFFHDMDPVANVLSPENEFQGQAADPFDDDDDSAPEANGVNAGLFGEMFEYGDNLVDAPRKIKANTIHFAKKQKKVDIKQLKENLWSNVIDLTGEDDGTAQQVPGETTHFKDVVQGLSKKYSGDKMNEISVAYCFICLLHLANEKNLSVVNDGGFNDLKISRGTAQ
ncbi:hypothetical protein HDU84_008589 [Entophlyctis sp. JEL0112]|nr:hypothetical protein HDU84_008589 [Entophlyctis sp. JEL0112]